jgi:RND family efflux transporter MFP subunit
MNPNLSDPPPPVPPPGKSALLQQLRIDRNNNAVRMPKRTWVAAGGGAAVLLVLAAWVLYAWKQPVVVQTALAQSVAAAQGNTSVLDATGYVTARRQATVSSKVTGRVKDVLIEEGQHVTAGQVMARLDNADANAQWQLARTQLEVARAQLADLAVLEAQAERNYARQLDLVKRNFISEQAADDARTAVESRRANRQTQEKQVEAAQRNVELAQVNLNNTVITAPFSGVVTVKAAQPGEMVSPISAGGGFTRTGIGTIVDMDSLEVEVEVNESYIGRVQADQPVETHLNAYPDWKIPGKVIAIIPAADRSKATVKVRISIEGPRDTRIVPDMGARVAFLEKAEPAGEKRQPLPGVLIPSGAIRAQGDGNVVYVVDGDRARTRRVTLGQTYSELRQVLDGLKANERVVVRPPANLLDGDRVQIDVK